MGTPGFVYVLLNQSLPGCVKIGKTTRDSAVRAAELSTATGVPTPFLVAYEAYFDDCDQAEAHVHALLEADGLRLATNREFFSVSAPQAINAVIQAQNELGAGAQRQPEDHEFDVDGDFSLDDAPGAFQQRQPWNEVLEEAESYLYGYGDTLEDPIKAVELFKIAAKLGSAEAYIQLGQLHGGTQGLEWIKRGADRGLPECWLELANIFSGDQIYFDDILANRDNALKCFRRFFELVDPISFDNEVSRLYSQLSRYLATLNGQLTERDIVVVNHFISRFRPMLLSIPDISEKNAKIAKVGELLEEHHLAKHIIW